MGMRMVGGGGGGKAAAVMVSTSSPPWCVGRIAAVAAGSIRLLRHKPPSSCYLLLHHRTIRTTAATTTRLSGAHLLTPQSHPPLSLSLSLNNNNDNNKRRMTTRLPFFLRAHSSSHHNHDVNEPGSIDSPLISSMHSKIKEQLNAESVIVKDAYGDGRHVSIDVISSVFEGESAVSRQRMVYKAIWEELQNTVHAVDQMTTKTPSEAAATNK